MKNFKLALVALVLGTASIGASAQHYGHGYPYPVYPGYGYGYSGRDLGIGMVIGALGTALVYQSRPQVVVQPQVIVPANGAPNVIYLQDGTMLTYVYQSGLWVDRYGNAYSLPR